MKLGIVQTIWNAISDLVSTTLTIDIIFYIGLGFLLLMSVFFFIRTRTSYEYKLDKTADRLNEWLFKNQTITDKNLVEFNDIVKEKGSPKILRKYWQQYMLYRDKAPSEYMSTYNCIDKPLKTSSFTSNIKNFTMIYVVTAVLTFFLSLFHFASNSNITVSAAITQGMVASVLILFVGLILTLALRAMQNYNIATLYQTFNVFNRYIDKACVTIPKYVDFEILFTKQEIKEGIPILGEYLEKRARQEQEELEEAQRNAIAHEEYDFAQSGVDGALVLERAMKESETYINIKQRLLSEIQQFESEISTLKKNYENTSKDYQRKLQASKENMERLRQQQEESTNRIEVNYIRKQQQDEVKKQEQLEKDQEDATNKFNVEIKALTEEIDKRRSELESKKTAVQDAMQAEYQTFSSKLHKTIFDDVEKSKNESIDQVVSEKNQYAQAITYLKNEVDSRDQLIIAKDQTIAELATKLQEYLGTQYLAERGLLPQEDAVETVNEAEVPAEESVETTTPAEETTQNNDADEGYYDERGYYWFNNGTYYDANNNYHDLAGNVYDADGNVIETGAVVETKSSPKEHSDSEEAPEEGERVEVEEEKIEQSTTIEQPVANENETVAEEEQPAVEQEQPVENQPETQEQPVAVVEEAAVVEEEVENEPEVKFEDLSSKNYDNGTYYDENNLYHDINGKTYNTEGVLVEEEASKEEVANTELPPVEEVNEEPVAEAPKRKAGRPKKEKVEEATKRKVGRPKKEENGGNATPKRRAGRPKKEEMEGAEQPAKKVGRPKKEKVEEAPKRKVGRPKKEKVEEAPKRKVGRPKKNSNEQLLKQLGESLINISNKNN